MKIKKCKFDKGLCVYTVHKASVSGILLHLVGRQYSLFFIPLICTPLGFRPEIKLVLKKNSSHIILNYQTYLIFLELTYKLTPQ